MKKLRNKLDISILEKAKLKIITEYLLNILTLGLPAMHVI